MTRTLVRPPRAGRPARGSVDGSHEVRVEVDPEHVLPRARARLGRDSSLRHVEAVLGEHAERRGSSVPGSLRTDDEQRRAAGPRVDGRAAARRASGRARTRKRVRLRGLATGCRRRGPRGRTARRHAARARPPSRARRGRGASCRRRPCSSTRAAATAACAGTPRPAPAPGCASRRARSPRAVRPAAPRGRAGPAR